jgi:hypothetical protein
MKFISGLLVFNSILCLLVSSSCASTDDSIEDHDVQGSSGRWALYKFSAASAAEFKLDEVYILALDMGENGEISPIRFVLVSDSGNKINIEFGNFPVDLWNIEILMRDTELNSVNNLPINKIYTGQEIPSIPYLQ